MQPGSQWADGPSEFRTLWIWNQYTFKSDIESRRHQLRSCNGNYFKFKHTMHSHTTHLIVNINWKCREGKFVIALYPNRLLKNAIL